MYHQISLLSIVKMCTNYQHTVYKITGHFIKDAVPGLQLRIDGNLS